MEAIIYQTPDSNDSHDVRFDDNGTIKGFGFLPKKKTAPIIALIKCPQCDKENYAFSVMSGECAWCPFSTKNLVFSTTIVTLPS